MNERLRKIINYYGIEDQLKYFQSEVFELNEAILNHINKGVLERTFDSVLSVASSIFDFECTDYSLEHIKEEIADVMVMLKQFQLYYNISTGEIKKVMKYKIDRQLERINYEPKHAKNNGDKNG